jgi:hypothetical protein
MDPLRASALPTQDCRHFELDVTDRVTTLTLNQPDRRSGR